MDQAVGKDAVDPTSGGSNLPKELPPKSKSRITMRKKKKKSSINVSDPSSPSCSSSSSMQRGFRVSSNRRSTRAVISCARQKESDAQALALPLGMSIAAVVAQVLERKDEAGENLSVDHVSKICTLAVRKSLANVFGDKFDTFASNFEKSFGSTLLTLRLINESSQTHSRRLKKARFSPDMAPPMSITKEVDSTCETSRTKKENIPTYITYQHDREIPQQLGSNSMFRNVQNSFRSTLMNLARLNNENWCEGDDDSMSNWTPPSSIENIPTDLVNCELALHDGQINQQLVSVSSNKMHSLVDENVLTTLQNSVIEQARSNDLKTYEIGLTLKKLRLKETELSLNSESNFLERCKLSMGISKVSFKAEKFKYQLEDSRYGELLKKCIDCLVAGLLIMLACLAYGVYLYSHQRITEATSACTPTKESKSWWGIVNPMASFSSGIQVLMCHVQVGSRILFGSLMILAISYLLLQRASTSNQTMPVTFILLLLGIVCGFAGKFCVDALGGSGYHWLLYWEALCALHLFSNIFISTLHTILHGPIVVSENLRRRTIFPYWIRRCLFYATALFFLPLLCGFSPFAGLRQWKDHFSSMLIDLLPSSVY